MTTVEPFFPQVDEMILIISREVVVVFVDLKRDQVGKSGRAANWFRQSCVLLCFGEARARVT